MKIIIEHHDHKAAVLDEDVVDVCEAIDLVQKALIKIGYSPERVAGGFLVKAKEIRDSGIDIDI